MESIPNNNSRECAEIVRSPLAVLEEMLSEFDNSKKPEILIEFQRSMTSATNNEIGQAIQLVLHLKETLEDLTPLAEAELKRRLLENPN